MIKANRHRIFNTLFLVSSMLFCLSVNADIISKVQDPKSTLPSPKVKNMLFYLQRDPDANTVIYELNYKADGKLNTNNPVKGSWIRYNENGQRKGLNAIENKFAYGIQSKPMGNGDYQLLLVSYKKMPLYLKKSANTYKVHAMFNKIPVILTRIFVRVNGGSFFIPDIEYIELKGNDMTGKELSHKIII
ncbi:MAG TPA: DUF4833 domain-containing protein [Sphingobacteriaceae bacterium]|nr:DUF4833 domain-containing protein [Sphingobacteriaceae bacterium]